MFILCLLKFRSVFVYTEIHCNVEEDFHTVFLQLGAVDAEIKVKVLSDENTELKGSLFEAWSRSVCCHACYTYCQGFLPC